jgi:histidine kinase
MFAKKKEIHFGLVSRLIIVLGLILLVTIFTWGTFNLNYFKTRVMENIVASTDRLSKTILLGTHYAMMINSRDDIKQIINNIARQNEIQNIRIYNKQGEIKFSNRIAEVEQKTNIKAEACDICHRTAPPIADVDLNQRIRVIKPPSGPRLLGVISPVYNEPGCSSNGCHVHPKGKKVLGALDLVVSLESKDQEIAAYQKQLLALAIIIFLSTAGMICFFLIRSVNIPIRKLVRGTREIGRGCYSTRVDVKRSDEMGLLAKAINQMGQAIEEKQVELNKQRDDYQRLFELVPCLITVQDRNYQLVSYNREFAEKFDPKPGDFCYRVYKGRTEKCVVCPVEKTFADGDSHYSEESGRNKDGTIKHWIVRTSPIRNADGQIVAAMEMNLDITERKLLEERLELSEKKYHSIFNNIPNPVFVLDIDTLEILDGNASVHHVYGYLIGELLHTSFIDLFDDPAMGSHAHLLKKGTPIIRVRHRNKKGDIIFVNIKASPSEYHDRKVLLVTVDDVTKRLETEQQLIQASKMATLGEMATGVAHELNQPLSVIKTASSYFMKKIRNKEPIKDEILLTMAEEIDNHVERATRIINHMRQFGRKSDLDLEKVQINEVLSRAFEIFSQQLKVRGIQVLWQIAENLPPVMGNAGRLEQVFINLLINARDAIEEKWENAIDPAADKRIVISTAREAKEVVVRVCDTGCGIPKELRSRIFEPFYTTKKVGKGTGLGLSISYGILKECGARILAEPDPNGGACFILHFPIPEIASPSPGPF